MFLNISGIDCMCERGILQDINKDLLFHKEEPTRSIVDNAMPCLDDYFTENGLDWKYCTGVCTDSAASMTRTHYGVVKQIQERAPDIKWRQCFLNKESLATKQMLPELYVALKTLNYIKKCTKGVKDLMHIIYSSCTTMTQDGSQEDVCLNTFLN